MASFIQHANSGVSDGFFSSDKTSGKSTDSSEENAVDHVGHVPTLQDIQIRACVIHQRHGALTGGYSLDDWLEAEHELDEEQEQLEDEKPLKKERIH